MLGICETCLAWWWWGVSSAYMGGGAGVAADLAYDGNVIRIVSLWPMRRPCGATLA